MNQLTIQEKYIFTREMETILSSGLSIDEGLSLIEENAMESNLQAVAKEVKKSYFEYGNFTKAIVESQAFDSYLEKLVEIGELNGRLDTVMKELSFYYEREEDMANRMKEATTYPFVLLCMMTIIVGILVFKVLPVFEEVMKNMGGSLTSFSKMMMNFGKVFALVSFVILVIVFIIILIFLLSSKFKKDGNFFENFLSKFPLTKKLYMSMSLAKMTYALSLFVSSGYPLEETMEYIPSFITHPVLKEKMIKVQEDMKAGQSFSSAMNHQKVYSGTYVSMLNIGMKSGKQEEVLKKLVDLYQNEVVDSTSRFLNIIEPTIVAVLSLIVGIILLSIMMPLMGIMSSLG